jgi:hypothetical protein
MEVHVDEMTSTVEATDSRALLEPRIFERIVRAVLARVKEEGDRERRVREDTQVRSTSRRDERMTGCGR